MNPSISCPPCSQNRDQYIPCWNISHLSTILVEHKGRETRKREKKTNSYVYTETLKQQQRHTGCTSIFVLKFTCVYVFTVSRFEDPIYSYVEEKIVELNRTEKSKWFSVNIIVIWDTEPERTEPNRKCIWMEQNLFQG